MIHLVANDYLLREGDAPTCCFLIESGRLEVVLERAGGDRVLATLGPGEIVGEMALIDQAPRTASVRACEDCVLLPIAAEHVSKRLAASDPVLRLVLSTVLERFRTTLDSIGGRPPPAQMIRRKPAIVDAAALAELRVQKDFESALVQGDIRIYYQPIMQLDGGRLTGFEALARWVHPTHGLISPATFVPIAEASGLSAQLATVCLQQVVRDLPALRASAALCRAHIDEPRIAVNISGHDLTTPEFIAGLGSLAAGASGAITLELTETALVHSAAEAAEALVEAQRLGFKIAVDDFGTGYSSFNYIRTLPVDYLKIDRSFVQGALDCATTRSIVASMLQLAASIDVKVVGEGVETAEQLAMLRGFGCDYGQGYLLGRPLPLGPTLELMRSWRGTQPSKAVSRPAKAVA